MTTHDALPPATTPPPVPAVTPPPRWSRYVALGDSFTEGLWDLPPGTDACRGWADLLAGHLASRQHAAGAQPLAYANLAVRGRLLRPILREQVPEIKFVVGHGQQAPSQLEEVMTAFYDGQYDVLLSTTIVESGLDIPTANTLIVHRADMFGLAQLYQIRGRVGRAKSRAYAYLTTPTQKQITLSAEKRLKVLQSLDSLGAGFQLASHDLDIRGGGNLLGDEQSGHIKEVGVELYQQMLEDAVAAMKEGGDEEIMDARGWSPQINAGVAVPAPQMGASAA